MPASRCPACRAAVPAGAEWCSLCYADLRPAPVTVPPGPADPGSAPLETASPRDQPTVGGVGPQPRWPCVECGATVPMDLPACPACGRDFLAGLHEEEGVTGVSALDRLAGFATANRLAALGIGLAICGLFLLFWFVLGLLT